MFLMMEITLINILMKTPKITNILWFVINLDNHVPKRLIKISYFLLIKIINFCFKNLIFLFLKKIFIFPWDKNKYFYLEILSVNIWENNKFIDINKIKKIITPYEANLFRIMLIIN